MVTPMAFSPTRSCGLPVLKKSHDWISAAPSWTSMQGALDPLVAQPEKWHDWKIVVPLPMRMAWLAVLPMGQNPHAVNLTRSLVFRANLDGRHELTIGEGETGMSLAGVHLNADRFDVRTALGQNHVGFTVRGFHEMHANPGEDDEAA